MSDAIRYCDRCGRLISPGDLKSGAAVARGNVALCAECAPDVPRQPRPRTPAPRREPSRRAGTPVPGGAPQKKSNPQLILIAGGGAGLVVGLIATALLLSGPDAEQPASPVAPAVPALVAVPAPPPPAVAPAPAAAAAPASAPVPAAPPVTARRAIGDTRAAAPGAGPGAKLAEIEDIMEFGASQLDEVAPKVEALIAAHPGTPEAKEAKRLLERSKAAFVEEAEGILESAMKQAEGLLAKFRFDDASRSFTLVKMRYGESAWYRDVAGPRIDAMLKRVASEREELERSGRSLKDDFSNTDVKWDLSGEWDRSDGRLATAGEKTRIAFPPMLQGRVLSASATVTVRSWTTEGRPGGAGIMLHRDGTSFWLLRLLVSKGGTLRVEFHERYEGQGTAQQNKAKLTGLGWTDRGWEYGKPYRLTLTLTRDKIEGRAVAPDGKVCGRIGYELDGPAVTTGRPALTAVNVDAVFDDFEAVISDVE